MKRLLILSAALLLILGAVTTAPAVSDGPFTIFLKSKTATASRVYYQTDDPSQAGDYVWLTLPSSSSALLSVMNNAFQSGQKVKVRVGYPHTNTIDNNKAGTVRSAEFVW